MDRILAGDLLTKHDTNWQLWIDKFGDKKQKRRGGGAYKALHEENRQRTEAEEEDQHVGHVLGHMREGGRKFAKSPKLRRWETADSCRIFGSLEGNKVQGDFHITARGHGYTEFGMQQHLDHTSRPALKSWRPCPIHLTQSWPFIRPDSPGSLSKLTASLPSRFQLFPYHHRTLLRPTLSLASQPAR